MSRRGRSSTPISLFSFQDIITSVTGIMILVTLILAIEFLNRVQASPPQKTAEISEDLAGMAAEIAQLQKQLVQSQAQINEATDFDMDNVRQKTQMLQTTNQLLDDDLLKTQIQQQSAMKRQQDAVRENSQRRNDKETLQKLIQQAKEKQAALDKLKNSSQVIFNAPLGAAKSPWLIEISGNVAMVAPVGKKSRPLQFNSEAELLAWAKNRHCDSEYFVLMIKPSGLNRFQNIQNSLEGLGFETGFDLLEEKQTTLNPETGAVAE